MVRFSVSVIAEHGRGAEVTCAYAQGDGRKYIVTLRTDDWIAVPVRAFPGGAAGVIQLTHSFPTHRARMTTYGKPSCLHRLMLGPQCRFRSRAL